MNRTARRLLPAVAVLAAVGIALGATFDPSDASSRTPTATPTTVQAPKQPKAPVPTTAAPTTAPAKAPTTSPSTPAPKKGTEPAPVTQSTPQAPRPETPRHEPPQPESPVIVGPVHGDNPSACSDTADFGEFLPATEAEFRRTITRAWLLCEGPSFLGTMDAGIELRSDGRWSKLNWVDGDTLVRAAGPGQEGDWETLDIGPQNGRPTFQLNFNIDGVGTVISVPVFGEGPIASAPSLVRINNLPGLLVSDYVPLPAGMTILPAEDEQPDDEQCDTEVDGSYSPSTESEFRDAMTGSWLLCGGPSIFRTDEAGLELRPDGRWSKLEWTPDGALVRSVGPDNEGSWVTKDLSPWNEGDVFRIELTLDSGGWISMAPVFAGDDSSISKVRLDNMGNVADYVPTDSPEPGC